MSNQSERQLLSESESQPLQQAIEYLQYRYCLVPNEGLAEQLVDDLFHQTSSPRQAAFWALKTLVKWAAYSRYRCPNPALQELQLLREVYGQDEKQRLLDLNQDLLIALNHIRTHLGLENSAEQELRKLPLPDASQDTVTAMCDLELDPIWGFETLQRNPDPTPTIKTGTPLDVFFQEAPKEEAVEAPAPVAVEPPPPAPETKLAETTGTFSRVYKLPRHPSQPITPEDELLDYLTPGR